MTTDKPTAETSQDLPTEAALKQLVMDCGAVQHGHFKLASGRHSDIYIEKFRVLERPAVLARVARSVAEHFREKSPDVVAGPSTGGIVVAYEVARQLGLPAIYVETHEGKRVLKRGAKLSPGTRVLLVDDVLTTGTSLIEVLDVLREAGSELVGVGVLIDRAGKTIDFGTEFHASCRFEATSYAESELPDWLERIPVSTPGTRAKTVV